MTMRHGVLIAQQSRSDPSLNQCQFRTTSHPSILRQTRIGSTDGHHRVPSCIVHSPTPSASDSDEQELDLDMLTNRDSFGDSPIGDIPIDHCAKANDRVSRVRMLPIKREASRESLRSEGRTHLLLHNVGKTIQRTSSQLRRTRLFHLFYAFALPFYTILGAVVFQALDGEHDDRLLKEYQGRCQEERVEKLADVERICEQGGNCFGEMRRLLGEVEKCYRDWHTHNRTMTHSMSDFTNALVYAFSVYTTIGYGNMAADTTKCRLATIIYGALGIPLFFAFVKEEGNLCRTIFISIYNRVRKARKRCRCPYSDVDKLSTPSTTSKAPSPIPTYQNGHTRNCLTIPMSPNPSCTSQLSPTPLSPTPTTPNSDYQNDLPISLLEHGVKLDRLQRKSSSGSLFGSKALLDEQRRVFLAGCIVFILYILTASAVFSITTEFDYFTSVYFLFNSVALIGFGDVFPKNPTTILVYAVFMILGVVLFSMCYFILQEEIREKAVEASRKARMSISKYSHSLVAHAKSPWSRRNSPLYDSDAPDSAFDRLKKRRQSAPAVAVTSANGKTKFREI